MAYQKQEWNYKTPITPESLNHMEEGIANSIDLDSEQTIEGTKTFEQPVALNGAPTENNHAVRLEDIKVNYIDNQEVATNEYVNGKRVYAKRFTTNQTISTNSKITIKMNLLDYKERWIDLSNSYFINTIGASLPVITTYYVDYSSNPSLASAALFEDNIILISNSGWNETWTKVVTVKYTKK